MSSVPPSVGGATAASSEALQQLPGVPMRASMEQIEDDSTKEVNGDEESQTTYHGSMQADAPAAYDAAPPLSHAPSELPRGELCQARWAVRRAPGCSRNNPQQSMQPRAWLHTTSPLLGAAAAAAPAQAASSACTWLTWRQTTWP